MGSPNKVDHDVFVVHAEHDTPFVNGELLPMLGLFGGRVILSSELPFPAFTDDTRAELARLLQSPTPSRSDGQ